MRDYLDWNATTPLRGEAIAAMRSGETAGRCLLSVDGS